MVFPVIIRWGKENINISNIFEYQNGLALKQYLYTTTGVNPERQTITGIGKGILKDNDIIDESTPIKKLVRMMGTSDKIPEKPKEELVFLEDVAKEEEDVVMVSFQTSIDDLDIILLEQIC